MWANYQYFSYWLPSLYLLETILIKSYPVTGMTERHMTVESQLLIVIVEEFSNALGVTNSSQKLFIFMSFHMLKSFGVSLADRVSG